MERLFLRVFSWGLPLVLVAIFLGACSPGYVMQAAYEQGKVLWRRQPIEQVMLDSQVSPLTRIHLQFVRQAREFSQRIGLKPGSSYTYYSALDREVFSWLVVASRADKFELHTWWFPIVGTVPYKGYFSQEEAIAEAKRIKELGYEVSVRPVNAYSSLGWFNDPVLSSALKDSLLTTVETVIHETLHRTVWVPGEVAFNESFANFVGTRGAQQFFEQAQNPCSGLDEQLLALCGQQFEKARVEAGPSFERDLVLSVEITKLYESLKTLYESGKNREEVLKEREAIYGSWRDALRQRFPEYKGLQKLNNADIMQAKLYYTELAAFQDEFAHANGKWPDFLKAMQQLKEQHDDGSDIFAGLRKRSSQ